MVPDPRRTRTLLLFPVLAALAACGERNALTNPLSPGDGSRVAAAPQNGGKVNVKKFQLSSNTLGIEGAAVTGNVTVANSGSPIDGVSIRGQIIQGATTRQAMIKQVDCAGTPATLPIGTCDLTFSASASNSADGTGTLTAGSAVFELDVVQTSGNAVLASKSLNITLVLPLGISSLSLNSTTLVIDGPNVGWTATITNPGSAIHGVVLQGTVIQGATNRAAGGTTIDCGGGLGVLPTGTCSVSFVALASNTNSGNGTFVPGAATFQLQLLETGGTTTVLDTKTIAITLVSFGHPTITSIAVNPQNFAIDGPATAVTVVLNNSSGAPISGVRLSETLVQSLTSASRAAGGASVSCGAGDGVLPAGDCTMTLPAQASNSAAGTGTFIAQIANLNVSLVQTTANGDVTVDTKSTTVGLLPPPKPMIADATLGSAFVVLGGPTLTYSATIQNQNINSFTSVELLVLLTQNGVTYQTTGGTINCGSGPGVLPPGTCTVTGGLAVPASVPGLTLGAATIQVLLRQFTGTSLTPYDSKSIPVTVLTTTSTPIITNVTLSSSTLVLDNSGTTYTVGLGNPNTSYSNVLLQVNVYQAGVLRATTSSDVNCGAGTDVLPTGTCTITGQLFVSTTTVGLAPGAATLEVKLFQVVGGTAVVFDTKDLGVTVVGPALTITSLQLQSTTIAIGGTTGYTVTVNNPTNNSISDVFVQGEMIQGATDKGANGTNVLCGADSGVLTPGACTFQFTAAASNTSGPGTLVPGAATFRLTLYVYDGVNTTAYDVKDVPVTLVASP